MGGHLEHADVGIAHLEDVGEVMFLLYVVVADGREECKRGLCEQVDARVSQGNRGVMGTAVRGFDDLDGSVAIANHTTVHGVLRWSKDDDSVAVVHIVEKSLKMSTRDHGDVCGEHEYSWRSVLGRNAVDVRLQCLGRPLFRGLDEDGTFRKRFTDTIVDGVIDDDVYAFRVDERRTSIDNAGKEGLSMDGAEGFGNVGTHTFPLASGEDDNVDHGGTQGSFPFLSFIFKKEKFVGGGMDGGMDEWMDECTQCNPINRGHFVSHGQSHFQTGGGCPEGFRSAGPVSHDH